MSEIITPTWPENRDEATADRLIACAATGTLELDHRHDALYDAVPWGDKEAPEYGPAIRRWADAISATVSRAQFAALLVTMQSQDRAVADAAAQLIWDMTDDGGWLIEIMWDYLNARGYDAEAIVKQIRAEREKQQP